MRFLSPAIAVAFRVETMAPYGAFEPRRLETLRRTLGGEWARVSRRYALTHVVTQVIPHANAFGALVGDALDFARRAQRDDSLGVEVWEVPHRPWAFFAGRAVAAERPLDARKVLLGLVARGEDDAVVLEAAAPPPTAPGRVLRVERGTTAVRIEAEAEGPALLVVQDAFWPGWRASIDGRPAEILAADYLVRAVAWPPGRHVLEMTYEPPELRHGLVLSALGALAVLGLALAAWRRRPDGPA
jgi:hypothetical protein